MGRFQVDNPGGPGNPFGRHVARNRQLMLAYFTQEKVLALFDKLESMAAAGNVAAHNTLLKYLIGKPVAAPNPDRVNHEEWEMRREQPHVEEVCGHTQSQMPHQAVLVTQRVVDMSKTEKYHDRILGGIKEREAIEANQAARAERRARRKEERRRRRAGG
jgi:hypothetical protein